MKKDWKVYSIKDLGKVITGSTPSTKDDLNYSSNDYSFVKPSDIPQNQILYIDNTECYVSEYAFKNSRILPSGTVLITCIGIIGKVGITKNDCICNQQINAIIPNDKVNNKFLAYSIFAKRGALSLIANSPVVPIINKNDFSNIKLQIPPLQIQQQIVDELDSLTSIIDKHKKQLEELDTLAQSIFYDMFGDPITNEKGWETKKLGEISTSQIGITYKPEDVSDNGMGTVVLRSGNIQNSSLCFNDIIKVNKDIREDKYVKDGDILMCSRNGSFQLVGKVAMITTLKERMTYGAFMTVIRSDYQPFLFAFFKSPAFRSQLTTAKTATINQITIRMLENMQVILPPLTLQQEFASKIEAIEKQKELIKQSLSEVQQLFDSRMDYYLG